MVPVDRDRDSSPPSPTAMGPWPRGPASCSPRSALAPLSHLYVRINRPGPARYQAWNCGWMLDPAEAGGGCLRNLGPHGLDMFLHLTGEKAHVTG
jgi:hypothetical protein